MDRPILNAFVRELLEHDRLHAFAEALPTRARVSEPALPLLVAALHERLRRPLAILVPEAADARDLAGGAGWFVGEGRVALLPSRGVHWGSGLEPPPHLVGERARALDVLAAGGLVCASATALAEGMPPPAVRPAPIRLRDIAAHAELAEELALIGYERVERVAFVRAGQRVVVAFPHRGEALRTQNLLRKVEAETLDEPVLPREPGVQFAIAPARRGFVWRELGLVLLPDTQVFRRRPRPSDVRVGRALQSFADLRTGGHVVHEDHGVGKLLGFETKTVAGVTRDYLFLAFRGEDRLYVPHEQLGKVSRYIGADAKAPALSKLGGKAWQLLKSRARESVQELAGDLIKLYAQRQSAEGIAYDLSNEWLERLEASFPYRETDDQA